MPRKTYGATRAADDVIVAAYNDGQSVRQIAAEFGGSYHDVRDVLLRAGVNLRPRGTPPGATREQRPRTRAAVPRNGGRSTVRQVRELAELSQAELASVVGLSPGRISQLEAASVDRIRVGALAELAEGCGARLHVTVEFGDVAVVLFDSAVDRAEG